MNSKINKVQSLLSKADSARKENRLEEAQKNIVSAIEMSGRISDMGLFIQALNDLARIRRDLGNSASSIAAYQELANLQEKNKDQPGLAHTIRHLGDIHMDEGLYDVAEVYYKKSISIYKTDKQTPSLDHANALRGYALLLIQKDKKKEAVSHWKKAKDLYEKCRIATGVEECDHFIEKLTIK